MVRFLEKLFHRKSLTVGDQLRVERENHEQITQDVIPAARGSMRTTCAVALTGFRTATPRYSTTRIPAPKRPWGY